MEEKTRGDLINELNEIASAEVNDLIPDETKEEGSGDMLIGAAICAGISVLIAGGIFLWKRHKRKKSLKSIKEDDVIEVDDEIVDEDEPEEAVKPEKDK